MKNTTLCYITRGDQVLMLHRVKKEHDLNHDKWIGIGGKCEEGESPEECLLREAFLIDKHAAHERVLFDRLRAQKQEIVSQTLLAPQVCRLQ